MVCQVYVPPSIYSFCFVLAGGKYFGEYDMARVDLNDYLPCSECGKLVCNGQGDGEYCRGCASISSTCNGVYCDSCLVAADWIWPSESTDAEDWAKLEKHFGKDTVLEIRKLVENDDETYDYTTCKYCRKEEPHCCPTCGKPD